MKCFASGARQRSMKLVRYAGCAFASFITYHTPVVWKGRRNKSYALSHDVLVHARSRNELHALPDRMHAMTGPVAFYLVLLLHGLPFTQAQPYPNAADCEEAGAAFVKDVLAVDPGSKAVSFCIKTPREASGFPCEEKPAPEVAPAPPPDPNAVPPFELKSQPTAPLPPFADPGAAPASPKGLDQGPSWKFKEVPMEEPKQ